MKPLNWILRGLVVLGTVLLFIPGIDLPVPGTKPKIILLIDVSRSMDDKDKRNELENLFGELEPFKSGYTFQVREFADSLMNINKPLANMAFDRARTDIGMALENIETGDADAVLLVSDGRHNGHFDPTLKRTTVPLWTLAAGQPDLPDIGIEEAYLDAEPPSSPSSPSTLSPHSSPVPPPGASPTSTTATTPQTGRNLRIKIRSNLEKGTETGLSVYGRNGLLRRVNVTLAPSRLTDVSVSITLSDTTELLRIRLDSLENEDRTDNNSLDIMAVSGQGKIRLLFVAGMISDDTREIVRALREMPRFSLITRIELAPGRLTDDKDPNPQIIVVGPMISDLTVSTVSLLKKYLNRGTPVLFANASQNMPPSLLPFLPAREGGQGKAAGRVLTPLSDVLFLEWNLQSGTEEIKGYTAANGAEVVYSEPKIGFISAMKSPAHRTAFEFPSLGSRIRSDRKGFESFLEASLMYTLDPNAFPFSIQAANFNPGYARMTLYSQVPVQAGELEAWLTPDSHATSIVPTSPESFTLEAAVPKGNYNLNVSWRGKRRLLEQNIEVSEPVRESPSRGANYALLKQLAHDNNGGFIALKKEGEAPGGGAGEEGEGGGLKDFFSSLPRTKKIRFRPVENPFFVILIGSLLLLEIWQRRRNGLP